MLKNFINDNAIVNIYYLLVDSSITKQEVIIIKAILPLISFLFPLIITTPKYPFIFESLPSRFSHYRSSSKT